jgi:hypothetical protein
MMLSKQDSESINQSTNQSISQTSPNSISYKRLSLSFLYISMHCILGAGAAIDM